MTPPDEPIPVHSAAIALACSWCWVIGMVFPAFMIADFGWPGWVVFVVPNAIGAASVGFLLRSRRITEDFVRTHRMAIRLFTLATLAFHAYVLVCLLPAIGWLEGWWKPVGVVLALSVACALWARQSVGGFVRAGVVVMFASLLCVVLGGLTTGGQTFAAPSIDGDFPFPTVMLALAGTTLGFLTCPFLDATFLRVRAELDTPARARGAFAGAFSGPFLILVGMTAFYAKGLLGDGVISHYVLLHIVVQSLYTCAFHVRASRGARTSGAPRFDSPWLALAVGVVLALVIPWVGGFRLGYELMLSLYALPFPAYVWIVCVWAKRPDRRAMTVWAIAVVLAAPLFALGYLGQRWALVPLGVALVVGAPVLLRLVPSGVRSPAG
ncbi:MAG: hypothetical protein Tsb0013_24200 [Phycisphaerales bacterium]